MKKPWFGGKTLAAPLIWQALGNPSNFVDPFFGAGAVLFNRPHAPTIETVNDIDGFVANAFRALAADPEGVAGWCDQPPNETNVHAIHTWLVAQRETFTARLMGDPDYYDVRVAGRWLYGIACWIGGNWCSGRGPWQSVDGQLLHLGTGGHGVRRQLLHLGTGGQGVHRQRLHLGDGGRGVHRQRLHLGDGGHGADGLYAWFQALKERLRYVRVCCGDWQRVLGPSVTWKHGLTGILLDPPYSEEEDRDMGLYACDDGEVAHAVRAWCLDHGSNPLLRIVFCGYGDIHDALLTQGWRKVAWTAHGGMGNTGEARGRQNRHREVLYVSPHCCRMDEERQLALW